MVRDIGELNKRIEIQKNTPTLNAGGHRVDSWATVKKVWAKMRDVSGREFFSAAATQSENVTTFTIRCTEGLDSGMRIKYKDRLFDIKHIGCAEYVGDFMEIRADEQGKEGPLCQEPLASASTDSKT